MIPLVYSFRATSSPPPRETACILHTLSLAHPTDMRIKLRRCRARCTVLAHTHKRAGTLRCKAVQTARLLMHIYFARSESASLPMHISLPISPSLPPSLSFTSLCSSLLFSGAAFINIPGLCIGFSFSSAAVRLEIALYRTHRASLFPSVTATSRRIFTSKPNGKLIIDSKNTHTHKMEMKSGEGDTEKKREKNA